ncbi:hypothetical protein RCL_jg6604.t1 [Rhizophagus clarus]|uniref:Uncharacterized protein n=1 Tax=Rhizophagus clarus TaxID=94130 RepID=A0A8H3LHP3_9GLOM|nr:hypothetical protein RCL_jg6604.t1 [Rhizophagus clarus]
MRDDNYNKTLKYQILTSTEHLKFWKQELMRKNKGIATKRDEEIILQLKSTLDEVEISIDDFEKNSEFYDQEKTEEMSDLK